MNLGATGLSPEKVVQTFKHQLEDRKAELQANLRDRLAESEAARDSVQAREIQKLRDIEAALARIRGGVYGVCSDCGEAIPEARLWAHPTAKRCRPCQEIKEGTPSWPLLRHSRDLWQMVTRPACSI